MATELDYMEYANDGAAQAAYPSDAPTKVSNGSLTKEQCNALGDWSDGDTGDAESSQATFDGEETFKFDSKSVGNTARR